MFSDGNRVLAKHQSHADICLRLNVEDDVTRAVAHRIHRIEITRISGRCHISPLPLKILNNVLSQGCMPARAERARITQMEVLMLVAMRAHELGWWRNGAGFVCGEDCAAALAIDVTPHVVLLTPDDTKNASIANRRERALQSLAGEKGGGDKGLSDAARIASFFAS